MKTLGLKGVFQNLSAEIVREIMVLNPSRLIDDKERKLLELQEAEGDSPKALPNFVGFSRNYQIIKIGQDG